MNRLKIYLDTSVISFYFADDSPEFKNITIDFFENYSENYNLYISDIVLLEINKDKDPVSRKRMLEISKRFGIIKLNKFDELNNIAEIYIGNGVIPVKKVEDALHISYATYYEMDILLSWNFKHLANVNKEHKIIIENLKMGYNYPLRLLSPLEVLDDKDF
jgi:predicted nucleic acid-binding protein